MNKISTGISDLDKMLDGGLREGDVLLLTGSFFQGLADLALGMAVHVGLQEGRNVIVCSRNRTETSEQMLVVEAGLATQGAGVEPIDESSFKRYMKNAKRLSNADILLYQFDDAVTEMMGTLEINDVDLVVLIRDFDGSSKAWLDALTSDCKAPLVVVAGEKQSDPALKANIVIESHIQFTVTKNTYGPSGDLRS